MMNFFQSGLYTGMGGSGAPDSDATAFLLATGITDPTQSTAIDNLVKQLKNPALNSTVATQGLSTNNLWSKAAAIYPYVGGSATTHKYNLKDPRDLDAAYRILWSGGITHNSNGVTFNGSTGFGETYLNALTVYSTNYLSMHSYARTGSAGILMSAGANSYQTYDQGSADGSGPATNGNTFVANNLIQTGMLSISRDANYVYAYCDGAKTDIKPKAFSANDNSTFKLGRYGAASVIFSNHNVAFQSIMNALSDSETMSLHAIVRDYQTALSRAITIKNFIHTFGDSETEGFGVTIAQRWPHLVAATLGASYIEANKAISGSTLQHYPTASIPLGMIDRLSEIPYKRTNDTHLFIAYGINDATQQRLGTSGYSVATFSANLSTIIANAKTKGWSSSNIYIINNWYTNTTGMTAPGKAIYDSIGSAAATVCSTDGATLINPVTACIDSDLQADNLHFNSSGQSKNATYISAHL